MPDTDTKLFAGSVIAAVTGTALVFCTAPTARPVAGPAQAPDAQVVKRPVSAVSLRIPSIGVRTTVMSLGLTTAGALAVPPLTQASKAGWYVGSAAPGDGGPAVIVGHVDSDSGPAVFYHLSSLRPGSEVDVQRSDGRTAAYSVTAVQTYPKAHFPTTAVYARTPGATLRLITCSPPYDADHGGYQANTVVYAELQHLSIAPREVP